MGYSVKIVLKILGVSKSTYYYHVNSQQVDRKYSTGRPIPGYSYTEMGQKICDDQIKEWLLEIIQNDGYAYGYRKLTKYLQRFKKLRINKKKVYRLCKELDILQPQREMNPQHQKKIARNRTITDSNQLWETDIKYGYIAGEDRFFFVLSFIDVFDRAIVDYYIGLACSGQDAAETLKRALWRRNLYSKEQKPVIRSDNGPQFISHVFADTCASLNAEHERIPFKTPNMNAHIESYHSILEKECISRYEFQSYAEAYEAIRWFVEFYNDRRFHSSIYDLSPNEYILAVNEERVEALTVRV